MEEFQIYIPTKEEQDKIYDQTTRKDNNSHLGVHISSCHYDEDYIDEILQED